jgi:hypothetical protein
MVFPVEVAFNCDVLPLQTVAGVAVTAVGADGGALTEANTAVLGTVVHPLAVASA